jgi:hypothetical protein
MTDAMSMFTQACEQLAASDAGTALDHADLHGTNVVFDGSRSRVIDWGDCCVTHPFSTLFVTFSFILSPWEVHERQAAAVRLRDLYLGPWGGSTTENVRTFELAVWDAHDTRALAQAAEGTDDADAEATTLLAAWLTTKPSFVDGS